jgi:hypothetical protein
MSNLGGLRWDPFFIQAGDGFYEFWEQYLHDKKRDILFVIGQGFDPRMCNGLDAILSIGGEGTRNCLSISFDEGPNSASQEQFKLTQFNFDHLRQSLINRGRLIERTVIMWSTTGIAQRRVGSINASKIFSQLADFDGFSDIIVDVSAMPRSIYFSLIGKVLHIIDEYKKHVSQIDLNLHIIVSENPFLDSAIHDIGIDDSVTNPHGLGNDMEMEATADMPKIWIPILGENQLTQLECIHRVFRPDEICPVLPHPSVNPRRGDDLLLEYRSLLFDEWRIEPQSIFYASEKNPFDVYRQVHAVIEHYDKALHPLQGCKAGISAHSSKLLSIGALLVTYELRSKQSYKVGILHVDAQGYRIHVDRLLDRGVDNGQLYTLWLAGQCYDD